MKESQSRVCGIRDLSVTQVKGHASALICVYEQAAKADCEYLIYQNNQITML